MDKITRTLMLYSKLSRGERINKTDFCIEADCLPRTFDRDIEDIRLYLSESFLGTELVYDRSSNVYYFAGVVNTHIDSSEYLFIEKILMDTRVLRADEMNNLLLHLAQSSDNARKMVFHAKAALDGYDTRQRRAILKMHSDLSSIIGSETVIVVSCFDKDGDETFKALVPLEIRYSDNGIYLTAFEPDSAGDIISINIDGILSFSILRKQNGNEIRRKAEYLRKNNKEEKQWQRK